MVYRETTTPSGEGRKRARIWWQHGMACAPEYGGGHLLSSRNEEGEEGRVKEAKAKKKKKEEGEKIGIA